MSREGRMPNSNVTRGYGLLEGFLAKQRAKMADKLIPSIYRGGRILDIGCGSYPFFLMNTKFSEKYGLDKVVPDNYKQTIPESKIILINFDIEKEDILPFYSEYFDVVTMLAIFEHIAPKKLAKILRDIYRILKNGGICIVTTPASWTGGLLRFMAKFNLVSRVEIEEHKGTYSHSRISSIFQETNFTKEKLRFGYFEMFMNIWTTATK